MSETETALTWRQEQFCRHVADGATAACAARAAGYAQANAAHQGSALLARPEIRARVAQLRREQAEAARRDRDALLGALVELRRAAMAASDFRAALRAIEIQARLLGLLAERGGMARCACPARQTYWVAEEPEPAPPAPMPPQPAAALVPATPIDPHESPSNADAGSSPAPAAAPFAAAGEPRRSPPGCDSAPFDRAAASLRPDAAIRGFGRMAADCRSDGGRPDRQSHPSPPLPIRPGQAPAMPA